MAKKPNTAAVGDMISEAGAAFQKRTELLRANEVELSGAKSREIPVDGSKRGRKRKEETTPAQPEKKALPKKEKKTERITVRLTPEKLEKLQAIAETGGQTVSAVVEVFIEDGLAVYGD